MTSLKKVLALTLALALMLPGLGALAEEVSGTQKSGGLAEIATTLDRSFNAEIVPEVAINDPGRINITVEWVQPQLTFTNKSIAYSDLAVDESGDYLDDTAAAAVLAELGLKPETDGAIIDAIKAEVAAGTLDDVTYYLLGQDKDVELTLTNTSVSSSDGAFKGKLQITATSKDLNIKGIEGVLTTPTQQQDDPEDPGQKITVQAPLLLKSQATCAAEAADIQDETAKTAAINAYIDKTSYKYTYRNQADFLAGYTKDAAEPTKAAAYYTATPKAEDVIKDLTTTITFSVKIVEEKGGESA